MRDHPFIICANREEWLAERAKSLGASDAAAYIGISPWKTNERLWREKCGLVDGDDVSDNSAVEYGNQAEPLLRSFFALDHPEYRLTFDPFKIVQNPVLPFIAATPDGDLEEIATGRKGGLEIKTTRISSRSGWDKWEDRIPDYYYAQVCHQMSATGWEFVILVVQIKYTDAKGHARKEVRDYIIEREDVLSDIELIEKEATTFWGYVQSRKRPPLKLPTI